MQSKEYFQQYRKAHKAELAEQQRQYREAHKAELAEYQRQYYQAHKAELAEQRRQYYQAHKAELAEQQRIKSGMADIDQVQREFNNNPLPEHCRTCGKALPKLKNRKYLSYCDDACYRAAFAKYRSAKLVEVV
jgi:hypothetical protein